MNHTAEIRALKARIAELEAKLSPQAQEPQAFAYPDGIARNGRGEVIPAPDALSFEERYERECQERREAEACRKAELAANGNLYRDPCGLWRDARTGKLAKMIERENAERREADAALAEQHRADHERDALPE